MNLKIFILVFATVFSSIYGTCSAIIEAQDNHGTLSANRLVLGYVTLDDTPITVRKIYGIPDFIDDSNGSTYYYGKDFKILFIGRDNSSICDITTTANNGIATADGVCVGMSAEILKQVYGEPTYKRENATEINYWYYGNQENNWKYFQFKVVNGIITKISLHHVD